MTEEEKDHQAWIMGRVDTFLEPFFKDFNDDALMDGRVIEWASVLAPLSAAAIDAAMIEYHRHGPRSGSGKLIKPAAGDIYARANALTKAAYPVQSGPYIADAASIFADRIKRREAVGVKDLTNVSLIDEVERRDLLSSKTVSAIRERHQTKKD